MTQYLNTERVAEILCISKESARKFMREMPHICIGGRATKLSASLSATLSRRWSGASVTQRRSRRTRSSASGRSATTLLRAG